jgi:hypothetical protein
MAVIGLDAPEGFGHGCAGSFQHLHEHIGAADQRAGQTILRIQGARGSQNVIQHWRIEAEGARGIDKLTKTHRHGAVPDLVLGSLGEAKGQRGKIRHG